MIVFEQEQTRVENATKGEWRDIGDGAQLLVRGLSEPVGEAYQNRLAEIAASNGDGEDEELYWKACFQTIVMGWKNIRFADTKGDTAPFTEKNWCKFAKIPALTSPVRRIIADRELRSFSDAKADQEATKN